MANGSHIRAVGEGAPTDSQSPPDEALELDTPYIEDALEEWEDEPQVTARRWYDWALPVLFVGLIVGWTAFYGWANQSAMLSGTSPDQWIAWVTQWAIPVLLVVSVWLLAMRLSTREAARFGDAANALSLEARTLEERLIVVNRELSLAREFLAEQSRELDFLGRTATERLSTHSDRLQALIHNNGAQVDAIASVSQTAIENMDKLRDDLPVIANSARDVTNRIGGAGREAQGQLDALVAGFERLNEFGLASENQVRSFRGRVDEALAAFEAQARELDSIADNRFAALREKSEEFRAELAGREVDALSAIRHRAGKLSEEINAVRSALDEEEEQLLASMRARLVTLRDESSKVSQGLREGEEAAAEAWRSQTAALRERLVATVEEIQRIDATALENAQKKLAGLREEAERVDANLAQRNRKFHEEIEARREVFANDDERALAALAKRFERFDAELEARRQEHAARTEELEQHGLALNSRLENLDTIIASIAVNVGNADAALEGGSSRLQARLDDSRRVLAETGKSIGELTDASVRLLELIRAGSEHSRTDLVAALTSTEDRLREVEQRGEALRLLLDGAEAKGKSLSDYVILAKGVSEESAAHLESLHSRIDEANHRHQHEISRLQAQLVELGQQNDALSAKAQGQLRDAIAELETATRNVTATLTETSQAGITSLAETVGAESAKAVDRALSEHTRSAINDLEQAAARASDLSREAALQLRDQLTKVDELAGNLEARVNRARERAEEQTSNDFARRMAMITESLNSNSIDIAKALASEVPDTTWASYLRGDRSIFTRRSVRLLDNIEARDIAEIYDRDAEFRDNVSHYIADFETMLRTMLSTRDGNALGVTMLGSDMGKLYVALAQAIERLRE